MKGYDYSKNRLILPFLLLSAAMHIILFFALQSLPTTKNLLESPGHIMVELASTLNQGVATVEKAAAKAVQKYANPVAPVTVATQESVRGVKEEPLKTPPHSAPRMAEINSSSQRETAAVAGSSITNAASQNGSGREMAGTALPPQRSGAAVETSVGTANGPSFIRHVKPAYPPLARRMNREGKVLLRLTINETGTVTAIEVIENPGHGFAEAATDAVRNSTFSPARDNGKPVPSRAMLSIRFKLN